MSVLSPLAGFGAKAALTGLGIGSGGLLTPLLIGFGTSGLKALMEKTGRAVGGGADTSKIKADSKYGFGKEEAESYRKSMEEGIEERGWSPESLAMDVGMSYASALMPKIGITDKLDAAGNVMKDEAGNIIKETGITGGDLGKNISKAWEAGEMGELLTSKEGLLGMKSGIPTMPTVPLAEDIEFDMPWEDAEIPIDTKEGALKDLFSPSSEWESPLGEASETGLGASTPAYLSGKNRMTMNWDQGGRVPSKSPTISDYFNLQGVSLGGSNKQSLSQILGRK